MQYYQNPTLQYTTKSNYGIRKNPQLRPTTDNLGDILED